MRRRRSSQVVVGRRRSSRNFRLDSSMPRRELHASQSLKCSGRRTPWLVEDEASLIFLNFHLEGLTSYAIRLLLRPLGWLRRRSFAPNPIIPHSEAQRALGDEEHALRWRRSRSFANATVVLQISTTIVIAFSSSWFSALSVGESHDRVF